MRRAGPLLAFALLLVTNAVVLVGVASNRRGQPDSSLVLTERELRPGYIEKENSGMWLRLDWSDTDNGWNREQGWFDRRKLEEVGFDCRLSVADPSAELRYGKALPLQKYAVLEFEGEAWRRWLAGEEQALRDLEQQVERGTQAPKALEERRKAFESERAGHSRLFVVDVGKDAAELRRRYPDRSRHIVAGAILRLQYRKIWNDKTRAFGEPFLAGTVSELLVSTIHVPLDQRTVLDGILREKVGSAQPDGWTPPAYAYGPFAAATPRYEVTLDYGRRLEPWIVRVRRLEAGQAPAPTGRGGPGGLSGKVSASPKT